MRNGLIHHILTTLRLIQSKPVRPKYDYWIVIDDSTEGHKYVCFINGCGLAYKRRDSKFFTKEEAYAMADTLHLKTGHLYHAEPYHTPKEYKLNIRQYYIVELQSGLKGICRYDRIGALLAAHELNRRNPNERYGICAV